MYFNRLNHTVKGCALLDYITVCMCVLSKVCFCKVRDSLDNVVLHIVKTAITILSQTIYKPLASGCNHWFSSGIVRHSGRQPTPRLQCSLQHHNRNTSLFNFSITSVTSTNRSTEADPHTAFKHAETKASRWYWCFQVDLCGGRWRTIAEAVST